MANLQLVGCCSICSPVCPLLFIAPAFHKITGKTQLSNGRIAIVFRAAVTMTTMAAAKGHNHQSAVTYDRVREVISKPPDRRKDFEINSILPWFRNMKDTKVLGQLKPCEYNLHYSFTVIGLYSNWPIHARNCYIKYHDSVKQ